MQFDTSLDFDTGLGFPTKRKRRIDSFTPEDEETILGTLGRKALGGVAMLGNVLDLPGSSVRDVIAGENPFDQYLSPHTGENRVSGRDLLRQGGFISGEDTTGNWWGGLGAEILLDPTTYLTLGGSALTKGGQAFKAAGVLDDAAKIGLKAGRKIGPRVSRMTTTVGKGYDLLDDAGKALVDDYFKKNSLDLASVADQPLQTLGRASLPFTDIGFNFGSGKLSQGVAGYLDTAGEFLKASAPVRGARALFDPRVGGKLGYAEQQIAEEAYRAKWRSEKAAKVAHVGLLNQMSDGYKAMEESFGTNGRTDLPTYETYDRLVRLAAETNDNVDEAWRLLSDGGAQLPDNVATQVREIGQNVRNLNNTVHKSIEGKGGKANWILDREAQNGVSGFAHVPRYAGDAKPKDLAELRGSKVLKTTHAGMKQRSDAIRTVPAEIVNRMLVDDEVRDGTADILTKYGDYLDDAFDVDGKTGKAGHAEALKQYVDDHSVNPLFTYGTADDFLKYQMGAQAVDRNLDAMHEIVSRTMDPTIPDGVTIRRAFKNAGLTDQAIEHWAKKNNLDPAMADGMKIPVDVANALASVNRVFEQPEWAKAIGEAIDGFHGWWKNAMTVPFPAFHSRNFSSGQYMNMATGHIQTPADIASYGGSFTDAVKMLTSTGVPKDLQEELYTNGVLGKYTRAEDVGITAINANKLPGQPPGWNALNALDSFKSASDTLGPSYADAIPGGRFSRTALSAVNQTGSKVAENVEFLNRVPMFLYLKKKGWSAEAAAQMVDDLHVDYSKLSGFEKNVMRRLAPFYSFQRRIAPVIMQTILERPGGAMAQTIKAGSDLSNADPLTPEHISSTLAAPNPFKGPEFEGSSYLTGFGFPHEQLGQFIGGPRTMLREAASNLSPVVKAPLEWATGQSFFQAGPGGKGRDLEELDPTIGRTIGNIAGGDAWKTPTALEFFAANSPLSRVATTARQLTDTRKGIDEKAINLLTGVKVSDVSEKSQERVIQNRALDLMKEMGARTFDKPYFPSEVEAAMTPEELDQAQSLELLQAVLADRQKRRKKQAK